MSRVRHELPLPANIECLRCASELRGRISGIPGVSEAFVQWPASLVVLVQPDDVSEESLKTVLDEAVRGFAADPPHPKHADRIPASRAMAEEAAARRIAAERAQAAQLAHDESLHEDEEPNEEGADHEHRAQVPSSLASLAAPPAAERGHDHGEHEGHDHEDQASGHRHVHDHASQQAELKEMAQRNRRRLLFVVASGTIVMLAEIVGGLVANSLVLLADAAHYATDIAAVLLAFFAVTWAMKAATKHKTFGYHRAEVVAAFINALALWAVSIYFVYEAIQRLMHPPEVGGAIVFAVGGLSLVANGFLAWYLHRGGGHNINMRAAYVHILSDVLGSAAALATGAAIYFWGLHIADPILTLFITILILVFTWNLTKQTLHILLEGSPQHADPDEITAALLGLPQVKDVHDLHVWTLTSGIDSVSAHVVLREPARTDAVSHEIHRRLRDKYKIGHVTVQVEDPDCPCETVRHGWSGPASPS